MRAEVDEGDAEQPPVDILIHQKDKRVEVRDGNGLSASPACLKSMHAFLERMHQRDERR